jgi:hypothetical protein
MQALINAFATPVPDRAKAGTDKSPILSKVEGQKVTKQLISSKKSRFITGAYFNYATSPPKDRE